MAVPEGSSSGFASVPFHRAGTQAAAATEAGNGSRTAGHSWLTFFIEFFEDPSILGRAMTNGHLFADRRSCNTAVEP